MTAPIGLAYNLRFSPKIKTIQVTTRLKDGKYIVIFQENPKELPANQVPQLWMLIGNYKPISHINSDLKFNDTTYVLDSDKATEMWDTLQQLDNFEMVK